MPHRTVRLAAGSLAVLGLLSACSGTTGGASEPPASPTGAASAPGTDPSLKVPAPLSTQKLVSDPCSALGDADAAKLGLISPGKIDNRQPASCNWTSTQFPGNGVSVAPMTQNKNGLGDIYAQKAQQAYFEPATVQGYPAVYADKSDDRPSGTCFAWVGVTDQLAVSVGGVFGTGKNKNDPCGFLGTVATAMVDHLKAAA
ncbi:DUF3558 domain-containing protein [Amycolatopsis saalfeldensis]|uniref:DUF3558 domain-containing protein n=1 Tax=Amycolatopsis saalfeldensis TaxID=394193 RepID=A0A1H8YIL2_9PSEU|nr:DUF3558 domain-containing protein [Amycolatopsis saalfeldensis]SEP52010.1 Protein of unknown function [Amycolatopsis saalfeldensis]